MTQQQSLLHKLPSELLGTIIDAVQSIEDLLRLSTSCQLFRNTMTGSFWQRVLDERYKDIELTNKSCKKAMPPRKQVIQRVLRTCYGCQSVKTRKLKKHDILEKRMCVTCIHYKYEKMPVTRAKKLYKLKEEDLAGLRVAVKLNPVNHSYKHMRLFLCSDLQRAAERKRLLPKPKRAPRKVKSASSEPVQEQQASASQVTAQSQVEMKLEGEHVMTISSLPSQIDITAAVAC